MGCVTEPVRGSGRRGRARMGERVSSGSSDAPKDGVRKGSGAASPATGGSAPHLVAWLSRPDAAAKDPAKVEHIETHISHVFLIGSRALKLKKAIRLPFLDYSSLADRRRMAVRELLVNRLFAPELYLGLMPVMKNDGISAENGSTGRAIERFRFGPLLRLEGAPRGAALEGVLGDVAALDGLLGAWAGDPGVSDWLVVMRRFADEDRFDRLAAATALDAQDIVTLGDLLAGYHRRAAVRRDLGGAEGLARALGDVIATLESLSGSPWSAAELGRFSRRLDACLARAAARLEARRRHGRVRRCHGDLHLANICRFEGRVRAFDAIEFSDRIGVIDIAYDAAFPVMDLIAHRCPQAANLLFNRYLEATNEDGALDLWPMLLAIRATIRAMADAGAGERMSAYRYREVAEATLGLDRRPLWVAIGGLSGSGKSTLARILAPRLYPAPGALWLRSDGIRKRLFGRLPEERLEGVHAYSRTAHARTYRRLLARARLAARAGWPAILDATWLHEDSRGGLDHLAGHLEVPLSCFWIDVAPKILRERVAARGVDASDADLRVLERQLAQYHGAPPGWIRLPGEASPEELAARILAAVN